MKVYLQRHCEPTPGHPMDSARELTAEGKKQASTMADWLTRDIGRVDVVITSPFKRAMQTAEIMGDSLGAHVVSTTVLEPDGEPEAIWDEVRRIAQASEHVLIVGHMPSINALLCALQGLTGDDATKAIRFEHGAIAHLKLGKADTGIPTGPLHWFVQPSIVEKEESEQEVIEAARDLAACLL